MAVSRYEIFNYRLCHTIASVLAKWNVTVVNKTTKSLSVRWADLTNHLHGGVRHYITIARNTDNGALSHQILPSNTTHTQITGLAVYTEYSISVVGVSGVGLPFKSEQVLAMTDEGGE